MSAAPAADALPRSQLPLRRVAIDTWRENVAYLHRDCAVYRAEGFQALSKIEVRANGLRILATVNVVDDSAIVAHRLFRSYLGGLNVHATSETIMNMFEEARSGRDLPSKGFGADLEYCAEIDVTTVVPRLEVRGDVLAVVAHGLGEPRDTR